MTQTPKPEDIHTRIQNTVAILSSELKTLDAHARHVLQLAMETLQAADAAVTELEAELDLVTAPDLSAAEEAQRLRHRLEETEVQIAALQQKLSDANDKIRLEDEIHVSEHDRLKELERQTKRMEDILETDADVFGKFMDKALDQDQSSGRLKRRE